MSKASSALHIIEAELWPDERILWFGQPSPKASMLSRQIEVVFGLLWTAFSLALLPLTERGGQIVGLLFMTAFVSVGLLLLATPLREYWKAKSSYYAISDKRLLTVKRGGKSVKSVHLSAIHQVERVWQWGGLTLRIPTALISDGDGGQQVDYTELHGLPDAELAFRLLTKPLL